jgi:hypothetical protein
MTLSRIGALAPVNSTASGVVGEHKLPTRGYDIADELLRL